MLYLVRLFYFYTDASTVDAWLDQDSFVFVPGHCERVEKDFGATSGFYLGHIVSF